MTSWFPPLTPPLPFFLFKSLCYSPSVQPDSTDQIIHNISVLSTVCLPNNVKTTTISLSLSRYLSLLLSFSLSCYLSLSDCFFIVPFFSIFCLSLFVCLSVSLCISVSICLSLSIYFSLFVSLSIFLSLSPWCMLKNY